MLPVLPLAAEDERALRLDSISCHDPPSPRLLIDIINETGLISHNISSRAKIGRRRGPIRAADGTRLVWIAR
jgi:hypothetical protein